MPDLPYVGSTPQNQKPATPAMLVDGSGNYIEPGAKRAYTLASAGTLSNAVNVSGGRYFWAAESTNWNGATVTLQRLGQDGTTWRAVRNAADTADVALTANGSVDLLVGQGATLRVVVTGGPSTALYANLAGV